MVLFSNLNYIKEKSRQFGLVVLAYHVGLLYFKDNIHKYKTLKHADVMSITIRHNERHYHIAY